MGELGQVIELMQSARDRYSTLHAEVRTWTDMRLLAQAMIRWANRQPPGSVAMLTSEGEVPTEVEPETRQGSSRIWVENPSRYRLEMELGDGGTHVEVGRRWWLEPDPGPRRPLPYGDTLNFEEIYDPALLIAELWLEPTGTAEIAGRAGILVKALPRPTRRAGGMDFLALDPDADSYELVVDRERGVVLRLAATLGDELMSTQEVETIVFDEPLDDALFEEER